MQMHILSVIDSASLTVIDTVPVGAAPFDVAYDPVNNRVYAPLVTDSISVIDAATLEVIDSISIEQPGRITYDSVNNRIYITNNVLGELPGTISVIDAATLAIIDTIQVGVDPSDLVYDPINNRIYVTNVGSNTVSVIFL